jgi:NAD(P)H-hydrate epimerase
MSDSVIRLTRAQVREVDRRAIEEYGVPGVVLMENAAIGAAEVAWEMVGKAKGEWIDIICGGGNNGGDGLAIARHLHNFGAEVRVVLAIDPAKYSGEALINWQIVRRMALPMIGEDDALDYLKSVETGLVVDALFGTGLASPPRHSAAELIRAMNAKAPRILAVDLPSGLDCDTGEPLGNACVRAKRTVTFVAEKAGFANPASRQYTGEVTVADIGCPREVIEKVLQSSK